jgi:hypothetical protein
VIKFVSDLRQVGGFSLGSPVSSSNKTDCHDITEILLNVVLKLYNPNPFCPLEKTECFHLSRIVSLGQ